MELLNDFVKVINDYVKVINDSGLFGVGIYVLSLCFFWLIALAIVCYDEY